MNDNTLSVLRELFTLYGILANVDRIGTDQTYITVALLDMGIIFLYDEDGRLLSTYEYDASIDMGREYHYNDNRKTCFRVVDWNRTMLP